INELLVGLSGVFVAVLALGFTIWQVILTRIHNRISYRPILVLATEHSFEKKSFTVVLANNGLGPALIKSFRIRVGDRVIEGDHSNVVFNLVKELFSNVKYTISCGGISDKYCMPPSEIFNILSISFPEDVPMTSEEILEWLNTADLHISYESIYGEKFELDSKD
uniref:hypothetical protein n=1 Tax=Teredinibacter waterburyi TaxID=1500538 RepID=UPI001CAA833B